MKKSIELLLVVVIMIVVTSFVLLPYKDEVLFALSDQGFVNPQKIAENYESDALEGIFNNEIVSVPTYQDLAFDVNPYVLGETSSNKRIEIDLTSQRLKAFEGGREVYNFLISSGKWSRTPTGTFTIWTKLRYTRMTGGNKAIGTYYDLPNVPYTMFFYNAQVPKYRGYSTHGTYWHNNFGHPMSHGCINMKTAEAGQLFNWADLATPIVIYGNAPSV